MLARLLLKRATDQAVLDDHINNPQRYLAPIIIASMIDAMLFGVLASETLRYCRWFRDSTKFRLIVAALFVTNVAQSAIVFYTMITMLGLQFGDWEGTLTNLYFEAIMITEAVSGALSQAFFLERAYTLLVRRSIWASLLLIFAIPAILAGLALGLSSAAVTVIQATLSTDFANFKILEYFIISWKSVSLATDIVLTATIIHGLLSRRSHWSDTNSLIARLIRWILQAQCLPLAASLMFLVSYAYDPAANVCLIASFAEGKLAAISVVHVLNSRRHLRHDDATTEKTGEIEFPDRGTKSKSHGGRHSGGGNGGGFEGETLPPGGRLSNGRGRVYVQTLTVTKRSDADAALRDFDIESYHTGQLRSWSPTPSHRFNVDVDSSQQQPPHASTSNSNSNSAPPSPPANHLPYSTISNLYQPQPQPRQPTPSRSRSQSPFFFSSSSPRESASPRASSTSTSPYLSSPPPPPLGAVVVPSRPPPVRMSWSASDEDESEEGGGGGGGDGGLPSRESLEAAMARSSQVRLGEAEGGRQVKEFQDIVW